MKHFPGRASGRAVARAIALSLAILALVAASSIYRAYRHDLDTARLHASAGSQVVETPCGRIEYAASGSGVPVLVVHGAGGGFDQGMQFAGFLGDREYRIIAMSRFGYLRTPRPPDASAEAQALAHACLLDALTSSSGQPVTWLDDLFGTFDSARYTAENIPGARFLGFTSGGHVWVGHNDQVLSGIQTFVRTHAHPRSQSQ